MLSAVNEGLLLITFEKRDGTKGTMIMDPSSPEMGIRFTDQHFLAAHHDGLLDSLLVWDPKQQSICLWDEGNPLTYIWRSKRHILPIPACFTAARIEADSYNNLIFKLKVNEETLYSHTVLDNRGFRLPSGYQSRSLQIEVEGTDTVRQICVAEAPHELE